MDNHDSDDYELMPQHELDDLRHEVSILKKGSLSEGDKARALIDSMDRLTISINRLITILDDAQKDIIEEYQESKPAEKLNQLLDQNEMIAKALIAISDNINGSGSKNVISNSNPNQNSPIMQGMNAPGMQNTPAFRPISGQLSGQNMSGMNQNLPPMEQMGQMGQFPTMNNSLDNFPPLDNMPPLDPIPAPKKKFLGIM